MGLGIKYRLRYLGVKLRCTWGYYTWPKVKNGKVAVHCMFQNEASFIKEWLDYYFSQGIDHIFLTNDFSTDNIEEVLAPYVKRGWVTLEKGRRDLNFYQREMFHKNQVLKKQRKNYQWLGFLDGDEFVFHRDKRLKEALLEKSGYPGLVFSSFMYGTSGVASLKGHELMIEKLTHRFANEHKEHKHVKSFIQPSYGFHFFNCNPHYPQYSPKARLFWPDGKRFVPAENRIHDGEMRLNHYWYRTEDFYAKVKRPRRIFFEGGERPSKMENWHIKNANAIFDPVLVPAKAELKAFRKKTEN
jgi:hypothetical protein